MKPAPFAYSRPESVAEVLSLLADHGEAASVLAGGQSLVPLLSMRMARPDLLVDLNALADGMTSVRDGAEGLELGALVRQKTALASNTVRRACPLLSDALEYVGHPETRNRGTVCGSLAHADPAAELPAVVAALEGTLVLESVRGLREVAAEDFFVTWFTTRREPDELVTSLRLPPWRPGLGWSFQELARRHHDFALVAVAAVVELDPQGSFTFGRLAFAGVGPVPVRARKAEEALEGRSPSSETIAWLAELALHELQPATDVHASADYRRHLAGVLARRALAEAAARAGTGT